MARKTEASHVNVCQKIGVYRVFQNIDTLFQNVQALTNYLFLKKHFVSEQIFCSGSVLNVNYIPEQIICSDWRRDKYRLRTNYLSVDK